ncbi:hypothetical protein IGI04_017773 [Brassica rapa subsp. trilocularis]|uniref:No apical meristem-associated C-terminal domain-containing protein n=1 Tax=Brassica rapa subsp. trilocularis TaxID=1813537 RepID=A0ABQ7MB00_BRACM|nr:hypothetical protein IGI04_017773 [Brassica rapa subsp. trilocularis]
MRQGRPQLTLSEPSAMAPSFSPPMSVPPGAVPHASAGSSSAAPAAPAPYVRRREDALLRAPSRRNQPHLHPDKINGALWFGIDPEVHAFIRATWQGNYWGSWASWNFVPPEKKDQWWHAFIQHYYWEDQFHDEIYLKWKKQTQVTVCGRISQKRRDNRQPSYMSDAHWATMVEKYNTEQAKKKSAKAAKSRKSAPVGKKMHKHGAGPRCFLNIQYNMMVDEGLDEPPSYTALARKTHTGKDGSFLDERTEELVLEVEEAVEEMLQDGSPHGDSQTDSTAASNAKRYLLNQEYIKRGKTKKGTIYGLGSAQYKNSSPSVPIPVSLKRNLDVDMRMSGFETTISEVKEDIAGVKEDFTALKTEINAFKTEVTGGMSASQATLNIILQTLQSQASTPASTAQPFQPQAQPQAPVQSHHQPQPQAQSTAPPQHLSTNTHSDLDRWCQELDICKTTYIKKRREYESFSPPDTTRQRSEGFVSAQSGDTDKAKKIRKAAIFTISFVACDSPSGNQLLWSIFKALRTFCAYQTLIFRSLYFLTSVAKMTYPAAPAASAAIATVPYSTFNSLRLGRNINKNGEFMGITILLLDELADLLRRGATHHDASSFTILETLMNHKANIRALPPLSLKREEKWSAAFWKMVT